MDAHAVPLSRQAGKHSSVFIGIPSILEKELGHSCPPDLWRGRRACGLFCNLPLTWTPKTKVNLSAAGTQLPFMLPQPPGLSPLSTEALLSRRGTPARLPALLQRGPRARAPPAEPLHPEKGFGVPRTHTGPFLLGAPAALMLRAWQPGSPAAWHSAGLFLGGLRKREPGALRPPGSPGEARGPGQCGAGRDAALPLARDSLGGLGTAAGAEFTRTRVSPPCSRPWPQASLPPGHATSRNASCIPAYGYFSL